MATQKKSIAYIVAWLGATAIVSATVMRHKTSNPVAPDSPLYLSLNMLGSITLGYYAYITQNYPATTANAVWFGVNLRTLLLLRRQR